MLPGHTRKKQKEKLLKIRNVFFLAALIGIAILALKEFADKVEMPEIKLQAPKLEYPDYETTKINKNK